jgi:hypothetical protein
MIRFLFEAYSTVDSYLVVSASTETMVDCVSELTLPSDVLTVLSLINSNFNPFNLS